MKTITDKALVAELLTRSVDSVYPSREVLEKALLSGKQLIIYVGIDPTADYVHLGHSTNYLLLERLHKLGHKIIVLVGDFTAMIGDPSDKTSERVRLTRDQVEQNLKTFKSQIGKILDFNDKENPIEFRFNSEWLSKLSFEQVIDLASNFTVQHMLERDLFEKRMKENKPLHVHEFFYPLMQGYDSVALNVDIEIGGTDQTFNMLAGRTLVKRYLNKEKFVITTTLLTNPVTGEKLMSKSLGTGVGLNLAPQDMFGKVMALADAGIIQIFVDCTRLSPDDIGVIRKRLESGENPKKIKLELAHEIVKMYYGEAAAQSAEEAFEKTFAKGGVPDDVLQVKFSKGDSLAELLIKAGVVESKADWRRLIDGGAVHAVAGISDDAKDEKIIDPNFTPKEVVVLKIGKRRFVKVIV